ncbi:flavodoxin family protein [Knoellia subterranea]|uniref:Flavodoxin n=1 Tax=Knoellia subterranea KCTC 19937 TaxID=1385521 RepID=A0A0A0JRH0_9MICO|nr:NAD(P)H-dependent oxidoreductase [Knoellia subterranea]KGN38647.1 flavodoxin [Knoellia subterranea KCTC 19937]
MPRLLVVHHSPTRSTRALLDAALEGATHPEILGVDVRVVAALEATAEDVLGADGYLVGTPANFGYMSGALKHFFDSTFLAVGGSLDDSGGAGASPAGLTARRPYGLWIHGRYDVTGAVRAVTSIVGALGWTQAADVHEVVGDVDSIARERATELGATLAALLSD